MTRRKQEGIQESDAILPSDAQEVNPAKVADEFNRFMDMPNRFTVEPLVKELANQAYPQDPSAGSYFVSGFSSGRRTEDRVSKYPIFPLSRMNDFEEVLEEMVFSWSHPTGKYSFDPLDEIHEMIARSDSEKAHRALVQHILLPFNRSNQQAWDGPNEMQFKHRIIAELFEAATYHGTPKLNPWAMASIADVYRGLRPGGLMYDSVEMGEAANGAPRPGSSAPSLRSVRDMQEAMLARMITYPDPTFDALVLETIETETVDRQRIFTTIKTLLGNVRKRDDGFYEDVADKVIAEHYDEEVAELLKEYLRNAWHGDDEEQEAKSDEAYRALLKRIVDVELYEAMSEGQADRGMLAFAIDRYPLDSTKFSYHEGGRGTSGFVPREGYLADLNYIMGLAKGPNILGVSTTAAYKLSKSFEHDFGEHKDLRAKAVALGLMRSVLSPNSEDYPQLIATKEVQSVLGAVTSILHRIPKATDKLDVLEIGEIMDMRAAFEEFAGDLDATKPDRDDPDFEEKWGAWYDLETIQRSFDSIEERIGERMQWVEIETKPYRYAEWAAGQVSRYARFIGARADGNGGWGRSPMIQLKNAMLLAEGQAELMVPEQEFDPVDVDGIVRLLAEQWQLHNQLMATDLRYDNNFRLEHSRMLHEVGYHMPIDMQLRALELIEAGEIRNFFYKEDTERLKKIRNSKKSKAQS